MIWAANEMKLRRAQAMCGRDASEADVKAQYVKLGGLVVGVPVNVEVETGEELKEEVADVVETPKKKTGKK